MNQALWLLGLDIGLRIARCLIDPGGTFCRVFTGELHGSNWA